MAGVQSPGGARRIVLLSLLLGAVVIGIRSFSRMAVQPPGAVPARVEVAGTASAVAQPAPSAVASAAHARRRDRAERDQIRERIYRSLGRTPPSAAQALKSARAGAPPVADAGKLDAAYIRNRIRQDFMPLAKECYEAALERSPDLRGKLVFSFVIVGDDTVGGIVESAEVDPSSTLTEAELVYCLRESLLSVSFEPPPESGVVTVTYPFIFSPDGPERN
jgi:hypothetical protein